MVALLKKTLALATALGISLTYNAAGYGILSQTA